jgi:hypothetical protein
MYTHNVRFACLGLALFAIQFASAQTLYTPGPVGASSTGRVGIGKSNPDGMLHLLQQSGGYNQLTLDTSFSGGNAFSINPFITGQDNGGFEIRDLSNSASRLVIQKGTGHVGVGVLNPTYRLDVQQGTNDTVIRALSTTAGAWYIADSATDGYFGLQLRSGGTPKWFIGSYGTAELTFKRGNVDGLEVLRIDQTGKLGIGTASPAGKLHVDGGGALADNIMVGSGSSGAGDNTFFSLSRTSVQGGAIQLDAFRSGVGGTHLLLNSRMGGNVGIGTTQPSEKLSVNGRIRAKEVIVETTGWSDYVFAEDYRLAPLSEVERHIQQHKHLPGVPSAAQVAEHGVSVGDMQAKLLAKVEELTLHVIRQQKEIDRLSRENTEMRTEIVELKN